MEAQIICPLCNITLDRVRSATCPGCGLWWIANPETEFLPGAIPDEPPTSLRLLLRDSFDSHWIVDLFMLAIGCLGLGAAVVVVWGVAMHPSAWSEWVKLLIGLPLGAWVGAYCIASVIGQIIHISIPSQLNGDLSHLQVRVWNTWGGLWQSFRRTDVRVPRNHIGGVAFSAGQGGHTQLFVLHPSGLAFGTGWSGTESEGLLLKESLLRWIATRRNQEMS